MSLFSYIFFPRKIYDENYLSHYTFYRIGYEKADSLGLIPWFARWNNHILSKTKYLSLTLFDCGGNEGFPFVTNPYSYELIENISEKLDLRHINYLKNNFGDKALDIALDTIVSDSINRHQLYHLINNNIKSGECVEIYSQWLDWDTPDTWGPPKHIYDLSLKEVFDNRKFYISNEENDLYIIHKP